MITRYPSRAKGVKSEGVFNRLFFMATIISYHYQLPKKAIKADCPACGPRYRKTLSRYVDTRTGETLPESYGRCDRESNCGYHLSPYHIRVSGISYAQEQQATPIPKAWFTLAGKQKRAGDSRQSLFQTLTLIEGATPQQAERVTAFIYDNNQSMGAKRQPYTASGESLIYTIPDEVVQPSLGHYQKNQFAQLLQIHFGMETAYELLTRFLIGTSARWPGACVFWFIDEQGRKRGGQIKLFDETFHTARYVDHTGQKKSKTSWVHAALTRQYQAQQAPIPGWLSTYIEHAERAPCLFGLPQLANAPFDQPVALVEAPKTAVLCTPYFPQFSWLAVGSLSYLNAKRLAPLRERNVVLFPDLSADGKAFARWSQTAQDLNQQGFSISMSDYLERRATDEQRLAGLDLADYLLEQWPGYPPEWDLATARVYDNQAETP